MQIQQTEWAPIEQSSLPTARDVASILFRQGRLILLFFMAVIALVAGSGMWVPQYQAQMKILVRRQRVDAMVTPQSNVSAQYNGNMITDEELNSEVELLNSQDLLRSVVLETGLADKHGFSLRTDNPEVRIAHAVQSLAKRLVIEPVRKTNMINVQYQATDPQVAAKVLNALATAYKAKHLAVERPTGEFTFFDQQREHYRQALIAAEKQLADFSAEHHLVSAGTERDYALGRMNQLDASAEQAATQMAEDQQRIRTLEAQLATTEPRLTTSVRTAANPMLMQQLKSTLLNLELKRTELLTKYAPGYRLVVEADEQIADAKAAIAAEETGPSHEETTDLDPNYQWVRGELLKARADLAGQKARVAAAQRMAAQSEATGRALSDAGLEQAQLLHQVELESENYLLYQHKSEEARVSDALDQRGILNVAIAEWPTVPAIPVRSPTSVLLAAVLLAGVASLSLGGVVDLLNPSFRTPDEVSRYLGIPVLAALPRPRLLRE